MLNQWIQLVKEALGKKTKDFTKGSINKALILLSIPLVLEMIMEALFAVVDVFFLSKVSVEAVAVVGLTVPPRPR